MSHPKKDYKHKVGEIRPSQLLFTYGIGAIVDLPELAVIVMGLEDWRCDPNTVHEIVEDRLLAVVRGLASYQVDKFSPRRQSLMTDSSPLSMKWRESAFPSLPFPAGWYALPVNYLLRWHRVYLNSKLIHFTPTGRITFTPTATGRKSRRQWFRRVSSSPVKTVTSMIFRGSNSSTEIPASVLHRCCVCLKEVLPGKPATCM